MTDLSLMLPGRATRRASVDALLGVLVVLMLLAGIAYTIDLASQFAAIRTAAEAQDRALMALVLPYLGQRGVDILARMLPTAVFFGVFLVEIRRRMRLESVILAASGVSPWRGFAALIWMGLILGGVLWLLEARLRPPAVWAQVESGLGGYADRFPAGWSSEVWLVAGDVALRAEVLRSTAPEMRDVLLFDGLAEASLRQVLSAETARPVGPGQWALTGVTRIDPATGTPAPQPDQIAALDLIPEQLRYRGFVELLLPSEALRALQAMQPPPANAAWADVELLRRATMWLYVPLIALIAAAVVPFGFEGRAVRVPRLIAFAAAGYFYVTAVKVVGRLGALDVIEPRLSVLGPLVASALLVPLLVRLAR